MGFKLLESAMVDFNTFCSADFSSIYTTDLGRRSVLYILRSLYDVLRRNSSFWKSLSHPYCSVMLDKLSSLRKRHDIPMKAVDLARGRGGKRRRDLDTMLGRLRDPYRCVITHGFHSNRYISFNTTVPLYAIEPVRHVCGYPSPFGVFEEGGTEQASKVVQSERRRKAINTLINALHSTSSSSSSAITSGPSLTSSSSSTTSPLSSNTSLSSSSSSEYTVTGTIQEL